jgi:hypothetical protein
MKVRKYKSSDQNEILTGMIVSSEVLGKIFHRLGQKAKPFRSKWCNTVAGWCLVHYAKYRKAPRGLIRNLFEKYAEENEHVEGLDLMEQYLESLSDKYKALSKEINAEYVIDLASRHFEIVLAEKRSQALEEAAERGDIEAIHKAEETFKPVRFGMGDWVHPFDATEINATFDYYEQPDRSLIKFKGALGEFLNDAFERSGFLSFVGSEKKGKSYWLQEAAWLGICQRRKVMKYILGDMSKQQYNERLYRRITQRPRSTRSVTVPKSICVVSPKEAGEVPTFKIKSKTAERPGISRASVKEARERLNQRTATNQELLRIKSAGAGIISASDIEADIRESASQGWVPDVLIIDYADLLKTEESANRLEYRHQINETWKVLRRISLEYHILVIVATQAAASNYSGWLMKKGDFSEDKRKNAHVTGMIGINQTSDEKKSGVYRLNWVFLRDGEWTDTQVVWCAGNLALACPCIVSALR